MLHPAAVHYQSRAFTGLFSKGKCKKLIATNQIAMFTNPIARNWLVVIRFSSMDCPAILIAGLLKNKSLVSHMDSTFLSVFQKEMQKL